jgi:hypothetical protein
MGSLAKSGTYGSDAWRSMARYKERLVLQLFVEHGPFWDAVSEVRQRRRIVPSREVPPPEFNSLGTMRYQEDVYRIRDAMIPERFYERFTFDWLGFIAACLIYQPPRTAEGLVEFATFGSGPYSYTFIAASMSAEESPQMLAPPIREFRGEDGVFRYDIRVDEDTSEADVRRAYWKIRAIRKKHSKAGAPKRDQMIAVQCAILYDEENLSDAADGRRKRWTHARLANRYGLNSGRAAKAHIELGRLILTGKVTVQ